MREIAAGKIIVKKSKFYAHLYTIASPEEMNMILQKHDSQYSNANHHCYAFICKDTSGDLIKQFQHDGEVGHPGKVLLQLLEQYELLNHALVVSRIFGGVKLGVGGVSRAFRKAGSGVILYAKKT